MAIKVNGLSVIDNTRNILNANTINGLTIPSDGSGTLALKTDFGVVGVTAGTGISGGGNTGVVTVAFDGNELATSTTSSEGLHFVVVDAGGTSHKLTKTSINLSNFNNDAAFSNTVGTVTSVAAGNGMIIGSGSGSINPQLDVVGGNGLTVGADSININADQRGVITQIGQDTNDYIAVNTTTIDFYLDGNLDARLEDDGDFHADGDVIAFSTTTSDQKFKDNVTVIENALDKVCAMRGVEFDWNATSRKGERDIGVIAQEVEKVIPYIVREKELQVGEFADNPETAKTVDYEKLTAVLIEAVKQLKAEIEELKENK